MLKLSRMMRMFSVAAPKKMKITPRIIKNGVFKSVKPIDAIKDPLRNMKIDSTQGEEPMETVDNVKNEPAKNDAIKVNEQSKHVSSKKGKLRRFVDDKTNNEVIR
jgi:hypothetical protein